MKEDYIINGMVEEIYDVLDNPKKWMFCGFIKKQNKINRLLSMQKYLYFVSGYQVLFDLYDCVLFLRGNTYSALKAHERAINFCYKKYNNSLNNVSGKRFLINDNILYDIIKE